MRFLIYLAAWPVESRHVRVRLYRRKVVRESDHSFAEQVTIMSQRSHHLSLNSQGCSTQHERATLGIEIMNHS
jgi:hypothetical protein